MRKSSHSLHTWVTTLQPQLFAPLYLVERLARVDRAVILEESQFDKRHFRVMLDGNVRLGVPFTKAGRRPMPQVYMFEGARWAEKFAKQFQIVYGKAPFKGDIEEHLLDEFQPAAMEELDASFLGYRCYDWIVETLSLPVTLYLSQDVIQIRPQEPTEWLAQLTDEVGGTHYMQGGNSMRSYFVEQKFEDRQIRLYEQDFRQDNADKSVLWWLCHHGIEGTRQAILADEGPGHMDTLKEWKR